MIVDFHSHVLPEMDDGSRSLEESLEMLRTMKSQGIMKVVATPHFYGSHEFPEHFLERRESAKAEILPYLTEEMPELLFGAEVAYFRGMSQSDALQSLCIEGTRAILVEMPVGQWSDSMYEELELIHSKRGLIPIVAHVDRYLGWLRDYGIPKRLAELPVLVQANASFFLGDEGDGFSGGSVRKALKMLERDQIHLLGSDAHRMPERFPKLGDAVKIIENALGREALERVAGWQARVLR